jgi:uncharacterized membrane protein required for colicin V production
VNVYVLLDALLLILIALFIPIGVWRGAYREAFVTLGILFGAVLAGFWGEPWGADLAAITRLNESGGTFMVAMLCLIGSTFLLGYSAGAAVPVPPPGWVARSMGALIAGVNGALLLSFALRDIRVYLLPGQETDFLDRAIVAPFLSDGTGWILLIGAAVFVPVVMVVALFGAPEEYDEYEDDLPYEPYGRPVDTTLAAGARAYPEDYHYAAYKAEPPGRADVSLAQETRPIRYGDRDELPESGNGGVEDSTQHELRFGFQPYPGREDETVHVEAAPRESAVDGRCPNCHADITNARGYCPSCGRII